jgi:hypothetical protein
VTVPAQPRYGRLNLPLVQRWLSMAPPQDGPFLAVNLMRYRPLAQYADGRPTTLTGREADDLYTPLGPLAAVGGRIVLAADVLEQPAGKPGFHRVAIVRYPTRSSFVEMERREDFQELHVHKDAGMEFTLILAAEPPAVAPGLGRDGGVLVLRLRRLAQGSPTPEEPAGLHVLLRMPAEGVIVGDERRWDEARVELLQEGTPVASPPGAVEEEIVMTLGVLLDDLAAAAGPPPAP